jgi:hypothetical protein
LSEWDEAQSNQALQGQARSTKNFITER